MLQNARRHGIPVPDGRPDPYFLDKTVRVTGEVSAHRGRPQIKVNDKDQITVVE